jgi:hypothetical protein
MLYIVSIFVSICFYFPVYRRTEDIRASYAAVCDEIESLRFLTE